MRNHRPLRCAAATIAAVAALSAGCTGNDDQRAAPTTSAGPTSAAPTTQHNTADVTFASNMIAHHRQAVEMAELAGTRASDPDVKELSEKIKQAQQPEIEQLTTWLTQWGATLPSADPSSATPSGEPAVTPTEETADPTPSEEMGSPSPSASPDGHGGNAAPSGMMSEQELRRLEDASGAEFDKLFLEMMIRHHEGAVRMATAEQQQGQHQAAKELARRIETSQQDEIAQMEALRTDD
ncbi:Uncharacterized conserved protein, DUF305 family [Micromonospora pattaloongensis]|uniref:Uncharacterized conserved protein, DUF305 family n=1 Tax=Micromonospora pattaloongensis TaxID=405436 RepID=A0A1H3NIS8_9ACTN|nr:DUF305 domain-containing protein [Micromonospora pattaloongensis]SDY88791.1 Uncharacterized conserved protein, DUF305 family [Micromonospora pattaloongensis]